MKQELPEELESAWKEHDEAAMEIIDKLARNEDKPFWSQGPRLAGRLGGLFYEVDSQFAAPTAAQMDYFEELKGDYNELSEELNRFFSIEVPALNALLETHGVPPVAVPEAIGLE